MVHDGQVTTRIVHSNCLMLDRSSTVLTQQSLTCSIGAHSVAVQLRTCTLWYKATLLQAMMAAPSDFNLSHMLQPALSVVLSLGLGALGGSALGAFLAAKPVSVPRVSGAMTRVTKHLPASVGSR